VQGVEREANESSDEEEENSETSINIKEYLDKD
jgi:hypothetical protein